MAESSHTGASGHHGTLDDLLDLHIAKYEADREAGIEYLPEHFIWLVLANVAEECSVRYELAEQHFGQAYCLDFEITPATILLHQPTLEYPDYPCLRLADLGLDHSMGREGVDAQSHADGGPPERAEILRKERAHVWQIGCAILQLMCNVRGPDFQPSQDLAINVLGVEEIMSRIQGPTDYDHLYSNSLTRLVERCLQPDKDEESRPSLRELAKSAQTGLDIASWNYRALRMSEGSLPAEWVVDRPRPVDPTYLGGSWGGHAVGTWAAYPGGTRSKRRAYKGVGLAVQAAAVAIQS